MIFQVIWKASLQFGYYVIYKEGKCLLVNVSLGLYPVHHFPDDPGVQFFRDMT